MVMYKIDRGGGGSKNRILGQTQLLCMHGHRPPTPPSSLGPLCRIDGTTFWLVGNFTTNLTLNTVFVKCTQRTPLHCKLRNLWQISGLWQPRFCISPQVALRNEILWQPDRGPDPTTSRFETESTTTEPQKLAYNRIKSSVGCLHCNGLKQIETDSTD